MKVANDAVISEEDKDTGRAPELGTGQHFVTTCGITGNLGIADTNDSNGVGYVFVRWLRQSTVLRYEDPDSLRLVKLCSATFARI
jgi:hypothetical protein